MKEIIMRILMMALMSVSGEIKQCMLDSLEVLDRKAKETDNPVDNILVEMLKAIIN